MIRIMAGTTEDITARTREPITTGTVVRTIIGMAAITITDEVSLASAAPDQTPSEAERWKHREFHEDHPDTWHDHWRWC
jgi:hypothetical protein